MIRFLLGHMPVQTDRLDPNTTLLQYLRRHAGRRGSKEGCASGDCGACTVVIAEPEAARLRYRTVNSCIAFLPILHGKQLITVEDLGTGQNLHPVQQAMVEEHGSQCGFCTPGFVMSLFALTKCRKPFDDRAILEALSGNLCRCTGYRPIIAAARRLREQECSDHFDRAEQETLAKLTEINIGPIALEHNGKRYFAPSNSAELTQLLNEYPAATLLAGGTDLGLEVTQALKAWQTLIYLGRVRELMQLAESDAELIIGAAVPYSDVYRQLCKFYPDCDELLQRLGSLPIRNQGTVGGNLGTASPIGDMAPILIALDATMTLNSAAGRRRIAVEEFFVDYRRTLLQTGEFIETVHVPKPRPGWQFRVYKISKRIDDDISTVCGAFSLSIEEGVIKDIGIAYGGMAATPKRARGCEQALRGQTWSLQTLIDAKPALAQDFAPIDDARASAAYRGLCAANLLERLYWELSQSEHATRVTAYA